MDSKARQTALAMQQAQSDEERKALVEFQTRNRKQRRAMVAATRKMVAKKKRRQQVALYRAQKYLARPDVQQVLQAARAQAEQEAAAQPTQEG